MADYGFIANPEQSSPMNSVKDILGVAQGAQQLQRSRQAYESENIDLQKARQGNQERIATQQFMQNPQNWQDEHGNIDMGKLNEAIPKIAPMTGSETINKLTTLASAQTGANKAKQEFDTSMGQSVGQLYGILGRAKVTDPKQVAAELDQLKARYPNSKPMQEYVDNAKVGLQNLQPGPHVTDTLIRQAQSFLSPPEQQSLAPTAGFLGTGSEQLPTVTTPSVGGTAPTITVGKPGTGVQNTLTPGERETTGAINGVPSTTVKDATGHVTGIVATPINGGPPGAAPPAAAPSSAPTAPSGPSEFSKPVALQYPVRAPGQPYAPGPSEQFDLAEGQKYRNGLVSTQTELVPVKRNIGEVLKTAQELQDSLRPSTGWVGGAVRTLAAGAGSTIYKQLSKDLANVEIAKAQATGGAMKSSVAGLDLTKAANGDETYPPEVLLNIARRTAAEVTDTDLRATAAQQFAQKFGDNNMKSFQQMWTKNADSKIFEVMTIDQTVKDPEERKRLVTDLLGKDKEQRQKFHEKYLNIQKLVKDGTL